MTGIEKINLENALRIADLWLSEFMHYEAPYFGSGEMEEIKKALEKQIPQKPNIHEGFMTVARCPVCNEIVAFKNEHCSGCGQKMDWSGDI